jgi:hypothetical protein
VEKELSKGLAIIFDSGAVIKIFIVMRMIQALAPDDGCTIPAAPAGLYSQENADV